jgi:hypothetical protein
MSFVENHQMQTAFALWLKYYHLESYNHSCIGGASFTKQEQVDLGASVAIPYLDTLQKYTNGVTTSLDVAKPLTREQARDDVDRKDRMLLRLQSCKQNIHTSTELL